MLFEWSGCPSLFELLTQETICLHQLSILDRYIGDDDAQEDPNVAPLVSPLFASEERMRDSLPPHWISVAGNDTLRSDGERMAAKLEKAGVEVVLDVAEGMQHVFEFMAGKAPEADESIRKIAKWVKKKLDM